MEPWLHRMQPTLEIEMMTLLTIQSPWVILLPAIGCAIGFSLVILLLGGAFAGEGEKTGGSFFVFWG